MLRPASVGKSKSNSPDVSCLQQVPDIWEYVWLMMLVILSYSAQAQVIPRDLKNTDQEVWQWVTIKSGIFLPVSGKLACL